MSNELLNEESQAVEKARRQAPMDIIGTQVEVTRACLHKKLNVTGDDLQVHGKRWYVLVELRNANPLDNEYGTLGTALYRVWPDPLTNELQAARVELYDCGIDELKVEEQ